MVHRAIRELETGRPRPVEIEVPPDVLERTGEVTLLEPEVHTRQQADPDLLERAAEWLGEGRASADLRRRRRAVERGVGGAARTGRASWRRR